MLLLLLLLLWQGVNSMNNSRTGRNYRQSPGYMRPNYMHGVFGGYVPCERGTCTSQEYCQQVGGEAVGYCYLPQMYNRGMCCSFRESCGQTTTNDVALFRNPNYPDMNRDPLNCAFTIVAKPGVCGVRVDFIQALLAPPANSACQQDIVTILHHSQNVAGYNVPFCGLISGVSTVVPVGESSKIQIVVTTQSPGSLWNIRLAQINCSLVHIPAIEACGSPSAVYSMPVTKENTMPITHDTTSHSNELPMFRLKQSAGLSMSRILGGTPTPKLYPWVVALFLDSRLRCGGSLITHQWVLTAGHCITIPPTPNLPDIARFSVILGAYDIYAPQERRRVTVTLSNIVRHPEYLAASNDIALLRLSQPVNFTLFIRPVCLPQKPDESYSGQKGVIAGWGLTGNGTVPTPVLLSAQVQVLNNSYCNQLWSVMNVFIEDSMLCAGQGRPSTCGGDSGGPLVVQQETNELYIIIGITSFGAPPMCGNPMFPDVWTRVTFYLDWIYMVLTEV